MNLRTDRRSFLKQSLAVAGGLSLTPSLFADDAAKTEPLYKISLAQWSLNRAIRAGKIDAMDFPKVSKENFDIHAVEYVNQFYMDKKQDKSYWQDLKKKCDDLEVKSLLIMCDREGNLGDPDEKKRQQAVENHYKWVEWAKLLGGHSIRVNAASGGSYEEQLERAADGLRKLTEFAAEHDMNVLVENHGGLSSNGEWLASVMKKVDHPRCGTLPDFGNFRLGGGKEYDRYKGVRELMPFAKAVSAKSHDFDEEGNETQTDYFKMMKIVVDAGYRGYVGVEYEGGKLSEPDGIKATKRLLERVREKLQA